MSSHTTWKNEAIIFSRHIVMIITLCMAKDSQWVNAQIKITARYCLIDRITID